MFAKTDNISSFRSNVRNIMKNTTSPTEDCYGSKNKKKKKKKKTGCFKSVLR